MREAYGLACQVFKDYSHKFSRHDFTLPQLFACLIVREMLKLSYRKTEALLRDSVAWLADIGMSQPLARFRRRNSESSLMSFR